VKAKRKFRDQHEFISEKNVIERSCGSEAYHVLATYFQQTLTQTLKGKIWPIIAKILVVLWGCGLVFLLKKIEMLPFLKQCFFPMDTLVVDQVKR